MEAVQRAKKVIGAIAERNAGRRGEMDTHRDAHQCITIASTACNAAKHINTTASADQHTAITSDPDDRHAISGNT